MGGGTLGRSLVPAGSEPRSLGRRLVPPEFDARSGEMMEALVV